MARMTALQMASTLRKQGVYVEIRFRKEGGARISKIGNKSFIGSEGNAEARRMLGQALSQTQQKHLQKIKTNKGTFGHRKKKALEDDLIKMQEKVNRAFKKGVKEGRFKQKGKDAPRITRAKIRYRLAKYGRQATEEYLQRAYKYAKGFTYTENLIALKQRLEADNAKKPSINIKRVIQALDACIMQDKSIQEKDFQDLLSLVYTWEQGVIKNKEFENSAMSILSKAA